MPSSTAETEEGTHVPSRPREPRKSSELTSHLAVEVCGGEEQELREARAGCWGATGPRGPPAAPHQGTVCFHFSFG